MSGEGRGERAGELKASSLHFGSEHRRANDVLIISVVALVFRAEQKLRTVKSDVRWELIGDEAVKGCIYIYEVI